MQPNRLITPIHTLFLHNIAVQTKVVAYFAAKPSITPNLTPKAEKPSNILKNPQKILPVYQDQPTLVPIKCKSRSPFT